MKEDVNSWVGRFYPSFHELEPVEQVVRLIYFHTVIAGQGCTRHKDVAALFDAIELGKPNNLPQLLFYASTRGKRLLKSDGGFRLRREIRQNIEEEQRQPSELPQVAAVPVPPFEFPNQIIKDAKINVLLKEAKACYRSDCWNACGILVRIIIERSLDSVSPAIKSASGLKDKLNLCISNPGTFSKSIVEALKELKGAKLIGDVVAHHSNIILDKHDIDVVVPAFRMLVKEINPLPGV
jgi:hypothetical protein